MDERRFDDLTRSLARGTSRRAILKGLVGGTLGALVGWEYGTPAAAFICRDPGVLCAKDAHCCSGTCGADHRCACPDGEILCGRTCAGCCDDDDCDGTDTCQDGQCITTSCVPATCADQEIECGTADDHCGNSIPCGTCTVGACQNGTCVCPSGTTLCGGDCVSTACNGGQAFSPASCACACPASTSLCNGQCVSTTCPGNQVFDLSSCTCGCPTDKPNDCGGGTCAACCTSNDCSGDTPVCDPQSGTCVASSGTCGGTSCAGCCQRGSCIELQNETDLMCGSGSQACFACGTCQSCDTSTGTCVTAADTKPCTVVSGGSSAPGICCHGTCVDPKTDDQNCGSCDSSCPPPAHAKATCTAGRCGYTCNAGYADCDQDPSNGCETALGTDDHCGSCGDACTGGKTCRNGSCRCPLSTHPCGGQCVTCSGLMTPNPTTCQCECTVQAVQCLAGMEWDPTACDCVCANGGTLCPSTGTCVVCSGGQVLDQTTCTCGCPTGFTLMPEVCSDGSAHCIPNADAENFCCTNDDCFSRPCAGNVCFENPCIKAASCVDHVCQNVQSFVGQSCTGSNPCGEYTCDESGNCILTGYQPSTTTCGSNGEVCFEGVCLPCYPDGEGVNGLTCPGDRQLCCSKQCYPIAVGAVCGPKPRCLSGSDGKDCVPAGAPCHVGKCSSQQCIDTGTARPFGFVCGTASDGANEVCIPGSQPECTHCIPDGEAIGSEAELANCDTLVKECCSGKCHLSDGSPLCGSGICTIGGKTYQAFEHNPNNDCQLCVPSQSHTSWTNNPGAPCSSPTAVCCTETGITFRCGPFGHHGSGPCNPDSGVCCSDGTCCLGCGTC